MNKRQKKKKDKRSVLMPTDEMNLIFMNEEELKTAFAEREAYRKKYGYRKKYQSKKPMKAYYFTMPERKAKELMEGMEGILKRCRTYKGPMMVTQSLTPIINSYNENFSKEIKQKNFKNLTDNWQIWTNVFTQKQEVVFEGTEVECEKFIKDNNPYMSQSKFHDLIMIGPHTGINEDFSTFDC